MQTCWQSRISLFHLKRNFDAADLNQDGMLMFEEWKEWVDGQQERQKKEEEESTEFTEETSDEV